MSDGESWVLRDAPPYPHKQLLMWDKEERLSALSDGAELGTEFDGADVVAYQLPGLRPYTLRRFKIGGTFRVTARHWTAV